MNISVLNKKRIIMKKSLIVAGLILLCSAHNSSYAAERPIIGTIIIKNNSAFDVKYKFDKPGQEVPQHEEFVLAPGDSFKTHEMTISIRRSGFGSGVVSSWIRVPNTVDLSKKLSRNDFQAYDLALRKGCTPVIRIQSGYTGGWDFALGYICF